MNETILTPCEAEEQDNRAYQQAAAQMRSISGMVSALNLDWDRLEELRDERDERQEALTEALEAFEEEHEKQEAEGFDLYQGGTSYGDACTALADAEEALYQWGREYGEELLWLEEEAGDYTSREEAEEGIYADPLSVEVRSSWYAPGDPDNKPDEFRILLCTGGPAVQIRGELDEYLQPCRAWLEHQDWFTPWTEYHGDNFDHDVLLTYCQQFYFGE